jgi:hypothetical protein
MPGNFEMFRYLESGWPLARRGGGVRHGRSHCAHHDRPSTETLYVNRPRRDRAASRMRPSRRYSREPLLPRVAQGVLKLYELVALGNRLFLDAIDDFKLPRIGSIERLKRSVRKATIPRNTKVLEISLTLHEPTPARALTLYVAEQTVKLAQDVAADKVKRPVATNTVVPLARIKTRND